MSEIFKSLTDSVSQNLFQFDHYDFTQFVKENIFGVMQGHLHSVANQLNCYYSVVKSCRPSAFLLNEDFATRGGFLAAFLDKRGISTFCISHANLVVDFSVPAENCVFDQSTTFVNSAYEKSMWEARGWNGRNIVVTGTPRYDRLIKISEDKQKLLKLSQLPLKFLYCATGLWLHSPNQRGYLGCHIVAYRQTQLARIRATLSAIRGLPVELIIKPHSDVAVPLWKDFVACEKPKARVRVTKHSQDIFQLYTECDAMLVPYWSTAIIETAMIGLPTIFLDIGLPHSPALYRFAEHGFCKVVQNEVDLRKEIESLLSLKNSKKPAGIRETVTEYYLGKKDTNNSSRVTDYITTTLKQTRQMKQQFDFLPAL